MSVILLLFMVSFACAQNSSMEVYTASDAYWVTQNSYFIWVVNQTGLVRIDKSNYERETYPLPAGFTLSEYQDGLTSDENGFVYLYSEKTIYKFFGGGYQQIEIPQYLQNFERLLSISVTNGKIIASAFPNGLLIYENNQWSRLNTSNGFYSNNVNEIHKDAQGNTWFSSYDHGLAYMNTNNILVRPAVLAADTCVTSFCFSSDNKLYYSDYYLIKKYDNNQVTTVTDQYYKIERLSPVGSDLLLVNTYESRPHLFFIAGYEAEVTFRADCYHSRSVYDPNYNVTWIAAGGLYRYSDYFNENEIPASNLDFPVLGYKEILNCKNDDFVIMGNQNLYEYKDGEWSYSPYTTMPVTIDENAIMGKDAAGNLAFITYDANGNSHLMKKIGTGWEVHELFNIGGALTPYSSFTIDYNGDLWVSTFMSVCKTSDYINWTIVWENSYVPLFLTVDYDNSVWFIAGERTIKRVSGGDIRTYEVPINTNVESGILSFDVRNGIPAVCTDSKVYQLHGTQFYSYGYSPSYRSRIKYGDDTRLWGVSNYLFCIKDGISHYYTELDLPTENSFIMTADKNDKVMIAFVNKQIYVYQVDTTAEQDQTEGIDLLAVQNYPNPFNPTTNLSFTVPKAGNVKISIYNTKGQIVNKLIDTTFEKGTHTITWNGVDGNGKTLSSGVYFCRVSVNESSVVHKMILMK